MQKKTDITEPYVPNDKDRNGLSDEIEGKLDYDLKADHPKVPKKKFWDTGFGQALRLKNPVGRVIATGATGVATNFLPAPLGGWLQNITNILIQTQTGAPMEVFDMNLLQLAIMAVALIIGLAFPSIFPSVKEKGAWEIVEGRIDTVAEEVIKAVDTDSDGGKKITRDELKVIIGSALKKEELPNG